MSKRQQDNRAILAIISQYIENNPDIRFGQALVNLNLITIDRNNSYKVTWNDEYYLEPEELLKRIKT